MLTYDEIAHWLKNKTDKEKLLTKSSLICQQQPDISYWYSVYQAVR